MAGQLPSRPELRIPALGTCVPINRLLHHRGLAQQVFGCTAARRQHHVSRGPLPLQIISSRFVGRNQHRQRSVLPTVFTMKQGRIPSGLPMIWET